MGLFSVIVSVMVIAAMILLGLCFGSFVNAMVWRLREQSLPASKRQSKGKLSKNQLSVAKGRSVCPNCGHQLSGLDLLPIISWVALGGKCRYCRKAISWQYPLVEAIAALLFVGSYVFWPRELEGWEIGAFSLWLVSLVGLIALVIYDIRWMLLPNRIVFPLYWVSAAYILMRCLSEQSAQPILSALGGVLIGGGIFYLLFRLSDGKWIGGGDVKLGFLLGALVATPLNAAIMLFFASLVGSLMILPLTIAGKMARGTRIPFGPFLILAAVIVVIFGSDISNWYTSYFIDV